MLTWTVDNVNSSAILTWQWLEVQANQAEAQAKAAEYEPNWTYQDDEGQPQGPLPLAALKAMLAK